MTEVPNSKQGRVKYDLEERTSKFAKNVRIFVFKLPKNFINMDDLKQLLDSSGSVGANYIEANESLSKGDFVLRIKICRKEVKESIYWLRLLEITNEQLSNERENLVAEATELMKIFGAIIEKCS